MFREIGLVSRLDSEDALKLAAEIHRFLSSKRLAIFPEAEFARLGRLRGGRRFSEMDVDLIITVGGDGTVLKTSMLIPRPDTPILAVNMGRRGYLAEVQPEDAIKAIQNCLEGKYRLEENVKLSVSLDDKQLADGLNEVLIAPTLPSKVLRFNMKLGGNPFLRSGGDGLIVATPTGSTAHALSAGGPILDPSLEAFVVVLICPVEPIRPVVIPAERNLEFRLTDAGSKATVVIDGRYQKDLSPRSSVKIGRSKHKAVFVRFANNRLGRSLMRFQAPERKIT